MQWFGPEEFALNSMLMEAKRRTAELAKNFDFMAQRNEFAKEMAALPCAPLHAISPEQLRHLRDWHGLEALRDRVKSPARAKWHERSMRQLEEVTSQWSGLPRA